jgi:MoaA/NifB/PqqE/SkfB family radical SAM enzyme
MLIRTRLRRWGRIASRVSWAFLDKDHPLLAHVIPIRRCNLACTYCHEFDAVSPPVPRPILERRLDRLAELGTSAVTFSGGEPLLHPEMPSLIAYTRRRGMFATLITNGYLLSRELIQALNQAGLEHLQISIDNVEPDAVSKKSLRLLDPKLVWLAELADFSVAINSVVGSGVGNPESAVTVARRARELGLMSSLGVIHDERGQLRPLGPRETEVYQELKGIGRRGLLRINAFQDNLAAASPNRWRCRAGARYLYVDEDGLVHYCSQQRGRPGIPLENYTIDHLRKEYLTPKACAPYCTVNCVQQVAVFDNWRAPQRGTLEVRRPAGFVTSEAVKSGEPAGRGTTQ